ncbi:MAG: NAD(P)/FAD-dependent oxidoreductase [Acidimicrobiaceae bacterium]|nr:NAD(P)/FAD-dependent oxidoreductase [Acidimicrobiaceae bacterium]MCY3642453.1 NAD(P)/FAD-dependent oxidoreductase [Acidimicrobiaceae bacterium]MXW89581.1 NAD(P)/FAD-dependent oxidoreductase [Acidimicrobiaceae bacterium]
MASHSAAEPGPVIIGAGPAGLTAAYQFAKHGVTSTVLEATSELGGISQTVQRDGWRFDIGGHRFFTKVGAVRDLWHEILGSEDFLVRPRLSRIYYGGKFYDYPLNIRNALSNLGPVEAARCAASYAWARLRPPKDQSSFEGYMAAQFGWRLYRTFFKTYTEKVWGVPATEIQADWAAQRIKNLNLMRAVTNALLPRRRTTSITSLIDSFEYPRHGPGMMWETCAGLVQARGVPLLMEHPVTAVRHRGGRAASVVARTGDRDVEIECSSVISSMPLPLLVESMDPAPPPEVLEAARGLTFRDFLTVALAVPADSAFADNWIYIHSPDVRVGRVQNFRSWSPHMVPDAGMTCLGLEYFVFEGDDLWTTPDEELVSLASRELETLGLVPAGAVAEGWVVRMPKAYPMYSQGYQRHVEVLRSWLEANASNVWPVGRNGMHRYNNQDHSMFTAMLAVENIVLGTAHDVWSVNVESEYHEELDEASAPTPSPQSD